MFQYFINNVLVSSDLELPCQSNISLDNFSGRTVNIFYGGCEPREFPCIHWIAQRPWSRAYDTGIGIMICALNDFKMHVSFEGNNITLFFDDKSVRAKSLGVACAINLGLAMSSLLRGDLPIHAASAVVGNQLIGMMAESGTGKTTTLWSLLDQGSQFFADDMTTVSMSSALPIAAPSVSQHAKLSQEALEMRGWLEQDFIETYPSSEEYWVPIALENRALVPRRLDALFVLSPAPFLATTDRILVRRVEGAQALSLFCDNMQGLWPIAEYISRRAFVDSCIQLSHSVPLYIVQYNKSYSTLKNLTNFIKHLSNII